MVKTSATSNDTGADLGFEAKLWAAADALRNNMDAAEYKYVVLGLIGGQATLVHPESLGWFVRYDLEIASGEPGIERYIADLYL